MLQDLDRYKEALQAINQAIELTPYSPILYINRGDIYESLQESKKAIAKYNKALIIDENFFLGYFSRGLFYYDLKEYDKAIADFTEAINKETLNGHIAFMVVDNEEISPPTNSNKIASIGL